MSSSSVFSILGSRFTPYSYSQLAPEHPPSSSSTQSLSMPQQEGGNRCRRILFYQAEKATQPPHESSTSSNDSQVIDSSNSQPFTLSSNLMLQALSQPKSPNLNIPEEREEQSSSSSTQLLGMPQQEGGNGCKRMLFYPDEKATQPPHESSTSSNDSQAIHSSNSQPFTLSSDLMLQALSQPKSANLNIPEEWKEQSSFSSSSQSSFTALKYPATPKKSRCTKKCITYIPKAVKTEDFNESTVKTFENISQFFQFSSNSPFASIPRNQFEKVGEGDCMRVYKINNSTATAFGTKVSSLVIKTLRHDADSVKTVKYSTIVSKLQKSQKLTRMAQEHHLPIAVIHNNDTMLSDGYQVMEKLEKLPPYQIHSATTKVEDLPDPILRRLKIAKVFFEFSYQYKILVDISPSNFMQTTDGQIVLADTITFGVDSDESKIFMENRVLLWSQVELTSDVQDSPSHVRASATYNPNIATYLSTSFPKENQQRILHQITH